MSDGNPFYRAAVGTIAGRPASYMWCVSWYVARVRVVWIYLWDNISHTELESTQQSTKPAPPTRTRHVHIRLMYNLAHVYIE